LFRLYGRRDLDENAEAEALGSVIIDAASAEELRALAAFLTRAAEDMERYPDGSIGRHFGLVQRHAFHWPDVEITRQMPPVPAVSPPFAFFAVLPGYAFAVADAEHPHLAWYARTGGRDDALDGDAWYERLRNILAFRPDIEGVFQVLVCSTEWFDPEGLTLVERTAFELTSGQLVMITQTVQHVGAFPPGRYEAQVWWSKERAYDHAWLTRIEDYPLSDSPDGVIVLRRLDP
jgi:hypothetical protein